MAEYAKRDKQIQELQCELDYRKNLLAKKLGALKETSKTNKLLKSVVEDYKLYHNNIVNDKRKQQAAMKKILEHLNMVLKNENLTTESLEYARTQQHAILAEMEFVKNSLDEILSSNNIHTNNEQ